MSSNSRTFQKRSTRKTPQRITTNTSDKRCYAFENGLTIFTASNTISTNVSSTSVITSVRNHLGLPRIFVNTASQALNAETVSPVAIENVKESLDRNPSPARTMSPVGPVNSDTAPESRTPIFRSRECFVQSSSMLDFSSAKPTLFRIVSWARSGSTVRGKVKSVEGNFVLQ